MARVGGAFIMGIIIAIITVAVGSAVGLALVGKTDSVVQSMNLGTTPETAFNNTVSTIYTSWPLLGLVVLALIGAAVILSIMVFR